jgi:hypothetical protein
MLGSTIKLVLIGLSAMTLLTGCIGLSIGSGTTTKPTTTLGQELMDLQKARDAGVITETEYQAQKAKLLSTRH